MIESMKWAFYFGAVLFASYLLLSNGVPWFPVLLGCLAAGAWNLWKRKRAA